MRQTPRIVFIYSGLGSYWPGMAAELLRDDTVFAARFREAERALAECAGIRISGIAEEKRPAISPGEEHALNFAYQLAMTARLREDGIRPDFFAGHSAGEVAAAVDAGALTLDEGAALVGAHRDVLDGWGERCGIAFVALPAGEASALRDALGCAVSDVVAAAVNDPGSVVFSGLPDQLDRCVARAAEQGVFARRLPLFSPLHHPCLAPRLGAMRRALAFLRPKDPGVPFLSSWRGGLSRPGDFDAGYWAAHVGEQNRFGDAVLSLPPGAYTAIEIAPHPVLGESLRSCFRAAGLSGKALAVARRHEPAHDTLQTMLRELRDGGNSAEPARRAPVKGIAADPKSLDELADEITCIVRTILGGRTGGIDADSGFLESGLDSVGLLRLKAELERGHGAELGVETFFHSPTPRRLAEKILGLDAAGAAVPATPAAGRDDGIAVIGMACRLPGGVEHPDEYWRLLLSGKDAIIPVPEDRWDRDAWHDPDPKRPGKTHTRAGGFLQRPVDAFDAEFFGMSGGEADALDPQQRLFLETAWEAIECAGIDPSSLKGKRVGVFLGLSADDYAIIHRYADPRRLGGYSLTGSTGSTACGRVSFFFGLEGPSYVVDTACSSSLACLHLARRALLNGEIDMALAGGANIMLIPEIHVCFSKLGATSADGRCKTFDESANGYGRGEGAGMLALRRAADARRDGDPVLAIVRGSAVNSDGRSSSLTAPNGRAQEAVAREALSQAGWRPEDVAYVETHGTGTPLGDAVEVAALGEVYGRARNGGTAPLRIGSAKPVIGHLEAAAGVASFIKVALAVGKGTLPASIGCASPNPAIDWDGLRVAVNREAAPWPDGRRRAGISAFGIGGTNCHVLLEDAGEDAPPGHGEEGRTELLTLSARTPEALRELCSRWAKTLAEGDARLADCAHTSRAGRARFRRRAAVTGKDRRTLAEALERLAASDATGRDAAPASTPAVVFLYPGQGAQKAGMGAALYREYSVYREAFDRAAAAFKGILPVPLAEAVFGESARDDMLQQHIFAQSSLFAAGVAATALWKSWGVVPAAVAGHSVGEYAAAWASGALRLEDAARLVAARAQAMEALPPGGGMYAARMGAEAARESFARLGFPDLEVAAANAPESITVSGPLATLRAWGGAMQAEGVAAKPLAVSGAFHSAAVEPVLSGLAGLGKEIECAEPGTAWWSTHRAERMAGRDFAGYWAEQTRGCVRFHDTVRALREAGNTLFVEMGPGTTLCGLGRAGCPDAVFLPGMGAPGQERESALRSLGVLWEKGVNPDAAGLNPGGSARRIALLPTYPFQRRRHWDAEARVFPGGNVAVGGIPGASSPSAAQPYLGAALDGPGVAEHVWESVYTDQFPEFMPEHVIFGRAIAPAAAYVSLAISAGVERWGLPLELADFEFSEPLVGEAAHPRRVRVVLGDGGDFSVFSKAPDEDGGAWLRHAHGTVRPLDASTGALAAAAPTRLAGDGVLEESHEELYRVFLDNQYALGNGFRKIRSARIGENAAECDIDATPPEHLRGLKLIYPGIMDSIIQTGMPAIGAKRREYVEGGKILIPMRIDRLLVRSLPEGALRSVGSVRHAEGATIHTLDVFDGDGAGIMRVEGMLLRQVAAGTLYRDARRRPGLFAEEWVECAASASDPVQIRGWIVAGGDAPEAEAVAEALRAAGETNILVADTGRGRSELAAAFTTLPDAQSDGWRFVYVAAGAEENDVASARRIVGGAYAFAQGLADAGLLERGRLWLLQKTDSDSLWTGALRGFGRSFRQEFPSVWGGRVEASSWRAPELHALLAAANAPGGEDEWRLREGAPARVPRIVSLPAPSRNDGRENSEHVAERIQGGTHLVTGGAGSLGRAFAGWLLRHGAARVVLCGRRDADAPEVAALLSELQGAAVDGQTVEYRRCDVADAAAVRALVAGLAAGAPLKGVFHAAGTLEDGAVGEKSRESVERALGAKALGAWHLHGATADLPLEFFVLFSSASSLLGSAGQTAYAAANAALDRLARLRARRSLPALAVQWGPWAGGGMASGAGKGDRLARFGMDGLSPEDALFGFEQALSSRRGAGVLSVMHIDWKAYFSQWLGGTRPGRFENVAPKEHGGAEETAGLAELLASTPREARRDILDAWLNSAARDILGRHESLDPDQPLLEQGFDSLMAIEWRNHMAKSLGRDIPSSFLFDYPTLRSVADSLLEKTPEEQPAQPVSENDAAGTRELLDDLDELLGK